MSRPLSWNLDRVFPLSKAQIDCLQRALQERSRQPSYAYPWEGLEQPLRVAAYGSILNRASAARTLSAESLDAARPVVVFGARRLFNYEIPAGSLGYGPPQPDTARAALNVRITGELQDVLNGLLVPIAPADIPAFRNREQAYDLGPLACLDWDHPEEPPFFAHVLHCAKRAHQGAPGINDSLEPHREYYRICRAGAARFGERFLEFWLNTTYLADGRTPVAEWENATWT